MRLIDADVLKADYGMADDCKDCKTEWKSCQYDRDYSKMDFCGWLDDAETVDAVPVAWIEDEIKELKEMDNTFSPLTANLLSAMLRRWKERESNADKG